MGPNLFKTLRNLKDFKTYSGFNKEEKLMWDKYLFVVYF